MPPEVSTLSTKVNYDNVDLSTGRIMPNIPLFPIGTYDLQDQVKLTYISGSGIKVNDYASDVGLGWDLDVGGYIVREVRGIPDDALIWPNGIPDYEEGDQLPRPILINGQSMLNGWLDYADWTGAITSQGPDTPFALGFPLRPINNKTIGSAINIFARNFMNDSVSHFRYRPTIYNTLYHNLLDVNGSSVSSGNLLDIVLDGQPDVFHYKCPGGYTGKFVFDENGNPTPIPYSPNIKISAPIGPMANNESRWIITLENGTRFYFPHNADYYEKIRTETDLFPYTDDWTGTPTPDRNEGIHVSEYISKWHVSEARSFVGNSLKYNYIDEPDFESKVSITVQQDFHTPGRGESGDASPQPDLFDYGSSASRKTPRDRKETTSFKKRLSQIECSDGSKVMLTYDGIEREDITNQKRALGSIVLKNMNNQDVEKYIFNLSHFNKAISLKKFAKRLKLNSIDKQDRKGIIHKKYYEFKYVTTVSLPNGSNLSLGIPARNSYQQDFWGYYNNNTENSLIPAIDNLEDGYRRRLPGADRSPDQERTKAYMLVKITLPTRGSIEYDYELNDFNNQERFSSIADSKKVPTGGLRIKSILQKEIGKPVLTKNFNYILPGTVNTSSGQIPVHLRKWMRNGAGRLFDKSTYYYWFGDPRKAIYVTRYSYPKYLQTSDLIRYSHVTVNENGKGRTVYRISAFDDYPDVEKIRVRWDFPNEFFYGGVNLNELYAKETFLTYNESSDIPGNRSPSPLNPLTDKSYLRGLILNIKEYKEGFSTPVKETSNVYQVNPDDFKVRKIYTLDSNAPWEFFNESVDTYEWGLTSLNFDISSHDIDLLVLKESKIKELVNQSKFLETTKEYTYNYEFNTIKEEKLISSNSSEYITKKYYPFDPEISSMPYMSSLIALNKTVTPVREEVYLDNNLLSAKQTNYQLFNISETEKDPSLIPLPKSILISKGDDSLEEQIKYYSYDKFGNPLEIGNTVGPHVTYIWSYNHRYPVAKLENATFSEVAKALNVTIEQLQNFKVGSLLNLGTLRIKLPHAQITTYTYDPLIGMTSQTDPRGYTTFYEYDELNRLKFIKDATGNILSENRYNYKEQ